ncbi:MAG TPA: hypothetical protein PLU50_08775 [Pseudobdellovibrionaceae bacterium]|nr:hypothetical protein [Pseudobdellovibrionaceae bacterium]
MMDGTGSEGSVNDQPHAVEAEKRRISASTIALAHCGVEVLRLTRSGLSFLNCLLLTINLKLYLQKIFAATQAE